MFEVDWFTNHFICTQRKRKSSLLPPLRLIKRAIYEVSAPLRLDFQYAWSEKQRIESF